MGKLEPGKEKFLRLKLQREILNSKLKIVAAEVHALQARLISLGVDSSVERKSKEISLPGSPTSDSQNSISNHLSTQDVLRIRLALKEGKLFASHMNYPEARELVAEQPEILAELRAFYPLEKNSN